MPVNKFVCCVNIPVIVNIQCCEFSGINVCAHNSEAALYFEGLNNRPSFFNACISYINRVHGC